MNLELLAYLFGILSWLIFWATLAVAGLFFLRVLLAWVGANPFGRINYYLTRFTEPFVRPVRAQFPGGIMRYDLIPLVMGVMQLVVCLFISGILAQFGGILLDMSRSSMSSRFLLANMIRLLGLLYVVAIFLRFFMPFFGIGYRSTFMRFLFTITEPLLKPLRRVFVMGMFDMSPLVAMLLVQLLTSFIAGMFI